MLAAAVLGASMAHAQADVSLVERQDGPSRSDALLGNGRLTVTASSDGVFTGLRWPSPAYFDQLYHVTARIPAPGPHPRSLPRLGAARTDGLWLGVRVRDGGGSRLISLDDPSLFERTAGYLSDTSRIARWTAGNDFLLLEQEALVLPEQDVLVIQLTVTPRMEPMELDAVLLAHPAPGATRLPHLPIADFWLDDPTRTPNNHFVLVHDARSEAVVAVQPQPAFRAEARRRALPLVQHKDGAGVLESVEDLSAVALAIGVDRRVQFQVGSADDGAGVLRPTDAFADAEDGTLEGNPVHLGNGTVGLLTALPTRGASVVTFFVALGGTPSQALTRLTDARSTPIASMREDAERSARTILDNAALPDTDDERARMAALRALIALEMLTDAETGSVVASAATQPAWGIDRATDAAIIDVALAHAARLSLAADHRALWASWQRQDDEDGPRGTFPGAFFPDGMPGTLVFNPLDGLALQLWAHARVVERSLSTVELADPTRPLRELTPSARLALDALLACVDEEANRPCPADSWDVPTRAQDDWQLSAALAGLSSGARLLEADPDRAEAARALHARYAATMRARIADAPREIPLHALALALGSGALFEPEDEDGRTPLMGALARARDALEAGGPDATLLPLTLWQLLVASREHTSERTEAAALLEALLRKGLSPFGHVGMVHGPAADGMLPTAAGTPMAAPEAALYLALLEHHGRRPPASLPVPDLPRCTCRTTGGAPEGLLLVGLTLLTRRAIRRFRRGKN